MNDASTIINRIKKNLKNRKNIAKEVSAYRLYEKDIPEYPYIIDIYNDYALIYEKGKKLDEDNPEEYELHKQHQSHIVTAIKETLNIPRANIIFKQRWRQKGKDQYEALNKQKAYHAKKSDYITVTEFNRKYFVNLYDYLDVGLFLDHRPLRNIIQKESKDKKVLNLFAYTGSISVAAALGGAKVTTVDMSKTYLSWAVDNFELNNIDPDQHDFLQADVLAVIEEIGPHEFDTIILDPPSFSNSKRMEDTFDVQRDHARLIHPLMKSLKQGGTLYFSNNFRKFKLDADILERYEVKDITPRSIPKDFRDPKIHVCYSITNK